MIEDIGQRFLIHFFSSGGLLIAAVLTWNWLLRRFRWLRDYEVLILPGLLILWLTATREAYDVWNGGSLLKSISDFISWAFGVGVWVFGLTRIGMWWSEREAKRG